MGENSMISGEVFVCLDADLKVIFFGRFESPVFFIFPRSKMDHFLGRGSVPFGCV